jgi:hypothetical protein
VGDPTREAHLGGVLRYALAAASLGAGLIHVTAVFDHTEHPVVATFFMLLAAAQVAWAVAVALRPAPALLKAGAALSLGVVAIWLVSRTTGFPGVPGAEHREPFGLKDAIASALEVLLAAGVVVQSAARGQALRLASGRLASGLAVSAIGVLTAAGLSAPGHEHREGARHRHSGSMAADHDDAGAGDMHPHSATGDGSGHEHAAPGNHAADTDHAAGTDHDAGHVHGEPAPSLALAAGEAHSDAEHDHNAPGHVHDPSHHHHHGGSSSRPAGHPAGPDHQPSHDSDAGHDHSAPGGEGHGHDPGHEDGSGKRHEDGHGHDHGDGRHDDDQSCTSPIPENQVVTTLQQAAQSVLGVGCHIVNKMSSPTGTLVDTARSPAAGSTSFRS